MTDQSYRAASDAVVKRRRPDGGEIAQKGKRHKRRPEWHKGTSEARR